MYKFYDVLVNDTKIGVYEATNGFNAAMDALKEEGYTGLRDWKQDFPNASLKAVKCNYKGRKVS